MVETASQNPYSAALHRTFDSEFQEELLSALNEADLSWSILTTHVQYTTAAEYSCFKPMKVVHYFKISKNNILVSLNVLKMGVMNTSRKFLVS